MTAAIGWTALVVVAFIASLAAHEAAHAVALRELGGDIKAAGLGVPVFPCVRLRPTEKRRWTLTLSPWLIGAYVEPDAETVDRIETWGYRARAWYSGAGVIANIVVGFGLLAASDAIAGHWTAVAVEVVLAGLVLAGPTAAMRVRGPADRAGRGRAHGVRAGDVADQRDAGCARHR